MNKEISYFKKALVMLMAVIMVFTMMPGMAWANTSTQDVNNSAKTVTQEEVAVVTDIKIKIQNEDILNGTFSRDVTDYHDLTMTDIGAGFKVFLTLSDEIQAQGTVYYEVYYDDKKGTGRGDSAIVNPGTPFQFVGATMATGKECKVSLKVGLKNDGKFTTYETYNFYITYMRGLGTLKVLENNKQVLKPNSPASEAYTYTNEFTGNIAKGTETVSVQIKPASTEATAYIGETAFTTKSYKASIPLQKYISEDGASARIPLRLEWPVSDESLSPKTREYTITLNFVDYKPTITTQPRNVNTGKGAQATLSVVATAPEGAALTYQWYEASGEGGTVIDGATEANYAVPTTAVGEKAYYCVITNTVNGLTYTVQSESVTTKIVEWDVEPPHIVSQSHDRTCAKNEYITLSVDVSAPAEGSLTYSWFVDGIQIPSEGSQVYAPDTSQVGSKDYYCRVAWHYNNTAYYFPTDKIKVVVSEEWTGLNYTPKITKQPQGVTCDKNSTPSLTVEVEEPTAGTLSYQWYKQSGEKMLGANAATFYPSTQYANSIYYYCEITNTVEGEKYTVKSEVVRVAVNLTYVSALTKIKDLGTYYKENPKSDVMVEYQTEYEAGTCPKEIFFQFGCGENTAVEYQVQVYHSMTNSFDDAEIVETATARKVSTKGNTATGISTIEYYINLNQGYSVGKHYFFCVVTASGKKVTDVPSASLTMGPLEITCTQATYDFVGAGTISDPYKISSVEGLVKLQKLVEEGKSFSGIYFQITANITLPADWKPIGCTKDGTNNVNGTSNLNAFSGIIDGKIDENTNATITVPKGGLPLLGFVKDAYVRNLNIYGEQIEGAGLVNNYTGVNLSGNAVTIENVRLLSGTKTLKSGLVASVGGNGFAHASAGFVVTIRNCVIEDNVTVGYGGTQSGIGSFAGRINGTVENCISAAMVKGSSYVGGILAMRDNAMSQCVVKNCTFSGTVEASGDYAGGIVGGGYDNATAPNGASPTIIACTVTGNVNGNERVGGIFGGDGYVAQTWDNVVGSISANRFSGKVSGNKYVGAIIGYRNSLNRYDTIENNFYTKDCGADTAIGYVKYLDTSYKNPTKNDGTIVFSTEKGTSGCPTVEGCAWKAQHNRTDDPLGADKEKLAKAVDTIPTEAICYELVLSSGKVKTDYILGEKFDFGNAKFTAKWTNGKETEVHTEDITVSGYNKDSHSIQTVTLSYGYGQLTVQVAVKQKPSTDPAKNTLTVKFTLLGDSQHDEPTDKGGPHGLATGGLTEWKSGTYEVKINTTVWELMQQIQNQSGGGKLNS